MMVAYDYNYDGKGSPLVAILSQWIASMVTYNHRIIVETLRVSNTNGIRESQTIL
jgi:hypothetical protein